MRVHAELTSTSSRQGSHAGPVARVADFARAVTSGRASDDVIAARNAQCDACDKLVRVDEKRYCGACGCGRTPWAELSTKLAFAHVKCPLGKPGFSA